MWNCSLEFIFQATFIPATPQHQLVTSIYELTSYLSVVFCLIFPWHIWCFHRFANRNSTIAIKINKSSDSSYEGKSLLAIVAFKRCQCGILPILLQCQVGILPILLHCQVGVLPILLQCQVGILPILLQCQVGVLPILLQCQVGILLILLQCQVGILPILLQCQVGVLPILLQCQVGVFPHGYDHLFCFTTFYCWNPTSFLN